MTPDRAVPAPRTRRTAARLAWSVAALAALLALAGTLIELTGDQGAGLAYPRFPNFVVGLLVGTTSAVVGAVIASRHPDNPVGWIFSGSGVSIAFTAFGLHYAARGLLIDPGSLPAAHWVSWLTTLSQVGWVPFFTFLLLLFPDGRLPSPRWRPLAWLTGLDMGLLALGLALTKGRPDQAVPGVDVPATAWAAGLLAAAWAGLLGLILACATALVVRLRRATGVERQQLRWFVSGAALLAATSVVNAAGYVRLLGLPWIWGQVLSALAAAGVSVAAAVAILRYRLYDIDLIINRAVVVLALAGFVTAGYVAVVAAIGAVIGDRVGVGASLVATTAVALAFQPVRRACQRLADRLVYGHRAAPYEVLADLAARMAAAPSPEEVLPGAAEAAARGLGAVHGQASLLLEDGSQVRCWPAGPPEPAPDYAMAVAYRGETVGQLAVTMPAGWALTPADRNLLAALAAEAGLVFRNLRLTAELRRQLERLSATAAELAASRRRIVTAQDEERRRLGRDLRRGPQRRLDGIAGRLGPAGDALAEDPARAAALLSELTGEANLALESLRDLARGVFPPLLGEQGLPAALRALARASGPATVTVGPGVDGRRFPPPVEAAVYFCCREAMGAGRPVTASLSAGSEALELSVSGVGDAGSLPLRQMADRVEALDGTLALDGTGLRARVPLAHGAAPARRG